jgi:hypothetical protein
VPDGREGADHEVGVDRPQDRIVLDVGRLAHCDAAAAGIEIAAEPDPDPARKRDVARKPRSGGDEDRADGHARRLDRLDGERRRARLSVKGGKLFGREDAYRFCGHSGVEPAAVELGAGEDHGPGFKRRARTDDRPVEHHDVGAEPAVVADRAGVDHGISPDGDADAEFRRVEVVGDVDGGGGAEIQVVARADVVAVRPDHRARAEPGARAQRCAAEHRGARRGGRRRGPRTWARCRGREGSGCRSSSRAP